MMWRLYRGISRWLNPTEQAPPPASGWRDVLKKSSPRRRRPEPDPTFEQAYPEHTPCVIEPRFLPNHVYDVPFGAMCRADQGGCAAALADEFNGYEHWTVSVYRRDGNGTPMMPDALVAEGVHRFRPVDLGGDDAEYQKIAKMWGEACEEHGLVNIGVAPALVCEPTRYTEEELRASRSAQPIDEWIRGIERPRE